ncbi:MAG TPA: phosphatase PAP2 family protein [Dehalococcoidia bacterium]|nr:phosphatase PAP2 family protein [Dehalococcoidia bacterium]
MSESRAESLDVADALREIGIVFAVAIPYYLVRGLVRGKREVAIANAKRIVDTERRLGIYIEPAVQSQTLRSGLRVHIWNAVYLWGHLPLLAAFAAWMYGADPILYQRLRRAFLVSQGIGAVIYFLYPVAPPRLMPAEFGYTDTLAERHELNYQLGSMKLFMNEYAAMPSLHFGWSLLMTAGLWSGVGGWKAKGVALLSPLASLASIVATANHWVLDAAGGAAVMAVSAAVTRR